MITFNEAHKIVLSNKTDFGFEIIPIENSLGRVLDEDILADRDFPPFNRSTKDGIALNYCAISDGRVSFKIEGIAAAGEAQLTLANKQNCIEIMTGAVLPNEADTIIMYEDITIVDDIATVVVQPEIGQNIHRKGVDCHQDSVIISKGKRISAAEIGIFATVGKLEVRVKRNPKIALVSTGNELVNIDDIPKPHQIRRSNTFTLYSALQEQKIIAEQFHISDDTITISEKLNQLINKYDVIMLSGGVSKGKFDYIPTVLENLGVEKLFHGVLQQPGKPFLFGIDKNRNTTIFSFPGNPVSTFVSYLVYFLPWLNESLSIHHKSSEVILDEAIIISGSATKFIGVKLRDIAGQLTASFINTNGSGDLIHLVAIDGFAILPPRVYEKGEVVSFVKTRL